MNERDKFINLINERYDEIQRTLEEILGYVKDDDYSRAFIADEIENLLKAIS